MTAIPTWTLDPMAGVAEHSVSIPADDLTALRRMAAESDVDLGAVLLAAHAVVLAALSGERVVTTGYVTAAGGSPLPCRLSTEVDTWRDLVAAAAAAGAEDPDAAYEVELDASGTAGAALADSTTLRVTYAAPGSLRLCYRTDRLGADAAARIAGYHRTALARIAAAPDAEPRRSELLTADEVRQQIDGLAGPHRELPASRVHELFEQRVRSHPEALAAAHGDRQWTYRELNARANRLGRALLARGLGREDVVAVVAERDLDWMAAVLAVFKAGGCYLPIEPHFPAERIATMLNRADCRLALTEPGSSATLDRALRTVPGAEAVSVDAAYSEGHSDGDLGIDVAADQLAYLFFTSGSTGEPKGAMCEHAGLLNHLYAKIDDLRIDGADVIAQTAPQCFDISLWQLVSALLVGGHTRIVEQAAVLDVERFVDTIVDGRVSVLQVVPSYLDAVLGYLEGRPRPFPDLRCVSVTGEALPMELVRRWFAARPDTTLVNAYGLTETSDDTNHEVMDRVPDGSRVPLGRAVNNVRVYVVDDRLGLVPLGAPGEIVFSGVCVGRGYVNDPDRTRRAFLTDPYRPGERLYRSGDYGRWRPDGSLEFLGRRDAQVKVAGFRIEIGDVENALVRLPGVGQAAAVVAEPAGGSKQLVAFCSGRRLETEQLHDRLGQWLPDYMLPAAIHWRDSLPLTTNGKVDRTALAALATDLDGGSPDLDAPRTATERRLAAAWATVLGVSADQIGRRDHFFERGGTSLVAVKLVVALRRTVSLQDVTRRPVLADLAAAIDRREN
jgi:amino acid adenylation domain-containing protein